MPRFLQTRTLGAAMVCMVQLGKPLALSLAFSSACDSAGPPVGGVLPIDDSPTVEVSSTAPAQACSLYPCIEACGQRIAMAPIEPDFGFSDAQSLTWRWMRGVALTDGRVLSVDQQRVELRDAADLRLLGSSALATLGGSTPTALDGRVWLQAKSAALAVIDTRSDTPTVTDWWFDAGRVAAASGPPRDLRTLQPRIELLGAVRGRLLLRVGLGFSAIEVGGEEGPREAFCIELPTSSLGTSSALLGDVLAFVERSEEGGPPVARLLRVSEDGASEIGSLPTGTELPLGGQGDRLTLTSDARRRITSYDVSGPAPVELAVAEGLPTHSDDASLGGFELRGFGDRRVAVDLQNRLERYDVRLLDDAPCLWRLEPRAGGDAYLVSPLWPEARRPAEPVPVVTCPERRGEYYPAAAALSPDERSVLFGDGTNNVWIVRDLATGEEQAEPMLPVAGAVLAGGDAHWIGDRVVTSRTLGGDYGVQTVTNLTVASALAPRAVFAELSSPGPVLSLRATETDLWALSYARGYEETGTGPLPNERVLWRLDPTTAAPQLQVLSSVRVSGMDQLAAHGAHAYLADTRKLRSIARDGSLMGEFPLPASQTSLVASELGVFITDRFQHIWQLAPGAESWTLLVRDCPACELRGAAGERIYVTLYNPGDGRNDDTRVHDWRLGYQELRAYAIAAGAATLVGRQRLTATELTSATTFDVGEDRVLINEGSLRVLEPLAEVP